MKRPPIDVAELSVVAVQRVGRTGTQSMRLLCLAGCTAWYTAVPAGFHVLICGVEAVVQILVIGLDELIDVLMCTMSSIFEIFSCRVCWFGRH